MYKNDINNTIISWMVSNGVLVFQESIDDLSDAIMEYDGDPEHIDTVVSMWQSRRELMVGRQYKLKLVKRLQEVV